jgi:hypothetical protein
MLVGAGEAPAAQDCGRFRRRKSRISPARAGRYQRGWLALSDELLSSRCHSRQQACITWISHLAVGST